MIEVVQFGRVWRSKAIISVDWTDFRIQIPFPFNHKEYSFKFNSSCVRYRIVLSLSKGTTVWAFGPFECGMYNDLAIFIFIVRTVFTANEFVTVNRGYYYSQVWTPNSGSPLYSKAYAKYRARHETFDRRLKQFNLLA